MIFCCGPKSMRPGIQTGIHMHLMESAYQKDYGRRTWGKTPLAHLHDLGVPGAGGFLCPRRLAHRWRHRAAVRRPAPRFATTPAPTCASRTASPPVNPMLARGVNVAMGTDSTAINDDDDILQEMRLVSKLHRQPGIDAPAISAGQVLAMATANAAIPTGFDGDIGTLEPGRRADLLLIRLDRLENPYLDPDTPPLELILGGPKRRHRSRNRRWRNTAARRRASTHQPGRSTPGTARATSPPPAARNAGHPPNGHPPGAPRRAVLPHPPAGHSNPHTTPTTAGYSAGMTPAKAQNRQTSDDVRY